jgi:hypothetical protein
MKLMVSCFSPPYASGVIETTKSEIKNHLLVKVSGISVEMMKDPEKRGDGYELKIRIYPNITGVLQ